MPTAAPPPHAPPRPNARQETKKKVGVVPGRGPGGAVTLASFGDEPLTQMGPRSLPSFLGGEADAPEFALAGY